MLPVPPPARLPGPVVDSHCHLDITQEYSQLAVSDALGAAADVGVAAVIQVGVDLPSSRRSVELAGEFDPVLGAVVGVHPNAAPALAGEGGLAAELDAIGELARQPPVLGIGETGLDHFRTGPEGRDAQRAAFAEQIELAADLDLTLVIHDRDAHADVLAVLEGAPRLPDRIVFHCFSGDAAMARIVADAGWYLSFAGVVTFKNAAELREALQAAPLSQVLVETDAPFLTPVPDRGKPNASYLMPNTVRGMADVADVPLPELCDLLRSNTERAFGRSLSLS